MDADGPWYGGTIAELPMGDAEAADLNADGDVADTIAGGRDSSSDGWVHVRRHQWRWLAE